jgi:2,4-dienoyl-CoA reductase-like NADH-dependent reductase (Old Yellow Enzyme family)
MEGTVAFGRELAKLGCDWIDVSSGGLLTGEHTSVGPGYQVPFAEQVRAQTGLTTMAVDMITEPCQAEAITSSGQADMVALARGMLYNPRWIWHAAAELGADVVYPNQYQRCRPVG